MSQETAENHAELVAVNTTVAYILSRLDAEARFCKHVNKSKIPPTFQ